MPPPKDTIFSVYLHKMLPVHQAIALDTLVVQIIALDFTGVAGISLHGVDPAAVCADHKAHMVGAAVQVPIKEDSVAGGDIFIPPCAPLPPRLKPWNTLRLAACKTRLTFSGLVVAP